MQCKLWHVFNFITFCNRNEFFFNLFFSIEEVNELHITTNINWRMAISKNSIKPLIGISAVESWQKKSVKKLAKVIQVPTKCSDRLLCVLGKNRVEINKRYIHINSCTHLRMRKSFVQPSTVQYDKFGSKKASPCLVCGTKRPKYYSQYPRLHPSPSTARIDYLPVCLSVCLPVAMCPVA